jgi:hypothetical protein
VVTSWPSFVSQCKSRLSAIARSCFLGRAHWQEKFQEVNEVLEKLREEWAQSEAYRGQLEQENGELRERVAELTTQLAQPQPVRLPLGDVPRGQQYGAGMMTLCVNLARKIGLRLAEHSLHIVFEWLGVEVRIPRYPTIRGWMQRIGLDRMQHAKKAAGGIWLTDHTNQIGKEKVLVVLRVPEAQLPRRGVPLRHPDVEVLAVVPGEEWKRGDVAKVYQETAARCGLPRAIETDGAVELREPAETLGKRPHKPLVIRDLKHFLANKFEALLNQDPQYPAFTKQLGGTRSALQQTELAHFIPPGFKMKARFMNLAPTLTWASAVLWHLDRPESRSRQGIKASRMLEKLGWLRDFAPSIRQWQVCQEVVSTALTFINQQGIFRGAAKQFQKLVARQVTNPLSQRLVHTVTAFLREYERKLRPHERLPMSTEILESSFSLYKQLEKQHSKSGFTSLLLTYPTLLRKTTPEEVTVSFARTKVADVKQWIEKHLPSTVAAKRQLVFREARTKTRTTTENGAMPRKAAA